jgi:hypothetical protein
LKIYGDAEVTLSTTILRVGAPDTIAGRGFTGAVETS